MSKTWQWARRAMIVAVSSAAMCVAGCGARQAGASRVDGSGRPVAVCTPHILGTIGSTLVVKTVCEVDLAALPERDEMAGRSAHGVTASPGIGAVGERREDSRVGGSGFAVGFAPTPAGPDGEPMPWPLTTADEAALAADEVAALVARSESARAWQVLDTLAMPALLAALDLLEQRWVLNALVQAPRPTWRLDAALAVRQIAHLDAVRLDQAALGQVSRAGAALERLGPEDRAAALEHVLARRALDPELAHALTGLFAAEGQVAWNEPVVADQPTSAGPGLGMIQPLPWDPKGQPPRLYKGKEAHKAIAAYYRESNKGDMIRSNAFPIASILAELRGLGHAPVPSALPAWELASRPDIVNLSRLHIYEIKPMHSQTLASWVVRIYLARFGRAGIAMGLGPPEARGTAGVVPGPGGWFVFWSPEPGVIVYDYRSTRITPDSDHQRAGDRPGEFVGDRAPRRDPARYLDDYHDDYDDDGLEFDADPAPSPGVVTAIGAALLGILVAIATAPVSG